LRWTKRAPLFSPQAAPVIAPTSSSISRFTVKPIISRRKSASGAFSSSACRSIISSVIGILRFGLVFATSILPERLDDRRASARQRQRRVIARWQAAALPFRYTT
jgi:hypothetical protein